MLFKNKTLLKTFLFFTTLFFITPSFAVKKINFYHDWINNYCSADASTVCNNHWTKKVMTLSNAADYKYVSCQTSTYSANIIYNFVRYTYVDGKEVKGWGPDGALGGTNIGVDSITCQDTEEMELIGCTAKCVPKVNQCTAKAGQREQRIAQCGLGTGTNCRYLDTPNAGDSKTYVCDNRTFQWLPLGGTYNVGGCEATVTNQTPLIKSNGNHEINEVFNGSGSVPLNCELTLTLTGNEYKAPTDGTTPPKTSPKDSDTGGSATSHTDDGTGGTPNTGGTSGLNPRQNSTPDPDTGGGDTGSGSGGTCTVTGQTLINGSCQCPSGQTVQNNQCTTTTNTGGGDSGGSCTITGQTQVNGSCQCPSGQTVQNNQCTASSSSGDGEEGSEGSYSGSNKCQQAPACSGDIILCGLMAEQYKSKCETLEQIGSVPDDIKQAANELGEEVANNQDINGMKQAVTGYMNTLQSLVVPSNSACNISNIQLQILAKTIEIPLSQFCPFFELIRLMLNITIDLLVLRIISRAVLSAG